MLEFPSTYWLIGYLAPPILFILWNRWNISRLTRRILLIWRKKEAHFLKEWSLKTRDTVEEELRVHIGKNLQGSFFLSLIFLANLLVLPLSFKVSTLGIFSTVGWLASALLMHVHLNSKSAKVMQNGIFLRQIVTHNRIKNELLVGSESNVSIFFPYLFTKSYQRSLDIESEFSSVIRKSTSAEEGKMLVSLLTNEDEGLKKDMNNAIMGRAPMNSIDSEENEALLTMISHSQDSSLPTEVRYRAMKLANELQKKKQPEKEFRGQRDALLDIETLENFYR